MFCPQLITKLSAQELINRSNELILSTVNEDSLLFSDINNCQYSITLPFPDFFSIYVGGKCPRLEDWSILPNNCLIGYMNNHKYIPDGKLVMTSETNLYQHIYADTPHSALFLGNMSNDQVYLSEYGVIQSFDITPIRNNKNDLLCSFNVFGVDYNDNQIQVGVFHNLQRAVDFIQLARSLL